MFGEIVVPEFCDGSFGYLQLDYISIYIYIHICTHTCIISVHTSKTLSPTRKPETFTGQASSTPGVAFPFVAPGGLPQAEAETPQP